MLVLLWSWCLLAKPILNQMVKQLDDMPRRSLSDPTRRAMVAPPDARASQPVTKLAEPLTMSLPAVSRHVRVLEGAGLVRPGRRAAPDLTLDPAAARRRSRTGWRPRDFWEPRLDALVDHFERRGR